MKDAPAVAAYIAAMEKAGWVNPSHLGDIKMRFRAKSDYDFEKMGRILMVEGFCAGYSVAVNYGGKGRKGYVIVVRDWASGGFTNDAMEASAHLVMASKRFPLDEQQDVVRRVFDAAMAEVDEASKS